MILKLRNGKIFFPRPFRERVRGYNAFTLAEVLITLGIIGIVAAMTMPTLIKKYQQHVTVTQLKKAYTEFSQALQKAEIEHGLMETWDLSYLNDPLEWATEFGEKYLFPNLKIVEKCIPSTNKCWADEIKNVSGNILVSTDHLSNTLNKRVSFVTASGYSGYYWLNNGFGMWYWVDINGPKKGPNKISRDIFAFQVSWGNGKAGKVTGAYNLPREDIKNNCTNKGKSYKNRHDGMYCGGLIMIDGWKISDDYPW